MAIELPPLSKSLSKYRRMTPMDVAQVVARISLKNPPFPINVSCWPDYRRPMAAAMIGEPGVITVHISWTVRDRDNGQPLVVNSLVDIEPFFDESQILARVERKVFEAFEHEFEECFHVDGIRVRDPHNKVKAIPDDDPTIRNTHGRFRGL